MDTAPTAMPAMLVVIGAFEDFLEREADGRITPMFALVIPPSSVLDALMQCAGIMPDASHSTQFPVRRSPRPRPQRPNGITTDNPLISRFLELHPELVQHDQHQGSSHAATSDEVVEEIRRLVRQIDAAQGQVDRAYDELEEKMSHEDAPTFAELDLSNITTATACPHTRQTCAQHIRDDAAHRRQFRDDAAHHRGRRSVPLHRRGDMGRKHARAVRQTARVDRRDWIDEITEQLLEANLTIPVAPCQLV